ncbi:hypothetical protein H0H92_005463 [Tricholoma furcatifolium]|nr:hypothetical protein H0H92_005463 [Tricholoma furcatifolium]
MTSTNVPPSQTFTYKQVPLPNNTLDIKLDVYPPAFVPTASSGVKSQIPAIIYFHGGGVVFGNRLSWFPNWLYERVAKAGYAFISADYRLIPPSTGHDVVEDLQDAMSFSVSREFSFPVGTFWVNPDAIAVAGSSGGGLCAYLAAMNSTSIKPKALISVYGKGGDFFTPNFLEVKTKPLYVSTSLLDPRDYTEYLHPNHDPTCSDPNSTTTKFFSLEPIADCPLKIVDSDPLAIPSHPRISVLGVHQQLGVWIDYYTGAHANGGLSVALREALQSQPPLDDLDAEDARVDDLLRKFVPAEHHKLFPSLGVNSNWPPTVLLHGTSDIAVPIGDSRALERRLKRRGIEVQLFEAEGKGHGYDLGPQADEQYRDVFDEVGEFLKKHLGSQ